MGNFKNISFEKKLIRYEQVGNIRIQDNQRFTYLLTRYTKELHLIKIEVINISFMFTTCSFLLNKNRAKKNGIQKKIIMNIKAW